MIAGKNFRFIKQSGNFLFDSSANLTTAGQGTAKIDDQLRNLPI
jgi:hypothetical protein